MTAALARRRSLALVLAAAGPLMAGLLAAPAQAAPPRSATYADGSGDAKHYAAARQLPAVYRTLGEIHEVKVYTSGGRLYFRMNLDVVLHDDANFRQDNVVSFVVGGQHFYALFGTDQRARLELDDTLRCGRQPRQTFSEATDRFEYSVPLSCLPAGRLLKPYIAAATVYRTNGGEQTVMARDTVPRMNDRGWIRIR